MEILQSFLPYLFVLQVLVAVCLVGFILIQHGKGADAGAAFGSGASSTVFGSQGSGNFLSRTTAFLAILFLGNSLLLGFLASQKIRQEQSLMQQESITVIEQEQIEIPVTTENIPKIPESDVPSVPE